MKTRVLYSQHKIMMLFVHVLQYKLKQQFQKTSLPTNPREISVLFILYFTLTTLVLETPQPTFPLKTSLF